MTESVAFSDGLAYIVVYKTHNSTETRGKFSIQEYSCGYSVNRVVSPQYKLFDLRWPVIDAASDGNGKPQHHPVLFEGTQYKTLEKQQENYLIYIFGLK